VVSLAVEKDIIPVCEGALSSVGGIGVSKKDCFTCVNWPFALVKYSFRAVESLFKVRVRCLADLKGKYLTFGCAGVRINIWRITWPRFYNQGLWH